MPDRLIGKWERLCIEREERERALARKGHPKGYWFDEKAAKFATKWIEKHCRHHKGEWKGRRLILEPWQIERCVAPVFGWKRDDGTRRYRKAWWEMPRKNGKTEIGAGVGNFLFIGDNEPGAEIYVTATKKEQAAICHVAMREMIKASPELSQAVKVPKRIHGNLVCDRLGAKVEILSADAETQDGLSPHGDIRDEVHQWKDHDLAEVLNTAMGSRRQPLTLEITTAGVYDPEGVGWQHHQYATELLEPGPNGLPLFDDDRQHVYITAIDDGDDPWDPAIWAKANPNLGISLKPSFIEDQANTARRSPSAAAAFFRLHLNRWTSQLNGWLDLDAWRACPAEPLDLAALRNVRAFGGLDLSSTTDLTAFVLVFILPDGTIALLPRFWLPEERVRLEEEKRGQSRYRTWREAGLLQTTPGNQVDYAFVRREVNVLCKEQFKGVAEIAFDVWNARQLAGELQSDGLPMVEVRQGPQTLSEPCKRFEGMVLDKQVRHGGNPILTWCAGNVVKRTDSNGNITPDKKNSKGKIDGIAATINALSRWVVAPQAKGPSVYESQGFKRL